MSENNIINFLSKIGKKGGKKTHRNKAYSKQLSQIAHAARWAEVRAKKALVDNSI